METTDLSLENVSKISDFAVFCQAILADFGKRGKLWRYFANKTEKIFSFFAFCI